MGSDMLAALGRASVAGRALFGHNSRRPATEVQTLTRKPGRTWSADEIVRLRHVHLPQARHTYTVLAGRPAGLWGYLHGVNEHSVAVGYTQIRTRLRAKAPALEGHELTRLALERSASARQAVDLIAGLVSRFGQGAAEGASEDVRDNAFLVVDAREAFLLETAGQHWAEQEIREVRAASGRCQLRQDWDRMSHGLADQLIAYGWWPEDGSKVDFAECVELPGDDHADVMRRWGGATVALEEQNGRIDAASLRRLLSRTEEGLCQQSADVHGMATASSLVVELPHPGDETPLAWCALGPPSLSVYFPVCLEGELPAVFRDPRQGGLCRRLHRLQAASGQLQPGARAMLAGLQVRFDQMAREFQEEARELLRRRERHALQRLATSLLEHAVDRFEAACDELSGVKVAAQADTMFPAGLGAYI